MHLYLKVMKLKSCTYKNLPLGDLRFCHKTQMEIHLSSLLHHITHNHNSQKIFFSFSQKINVGPLLLVIQNHAMDTHLRESAQLGLKLPARGFLRKRESARGRTTGRKPESALADTRDKNGRPSRPRLHLHHAPVWLPK